jgi:outer membrane protein OmpA-like peptidoglycan-associated protein
LLDAYSNELTAGIAVSTFQNGKWSKPERLEIPNLVAPNTLFGFHISQDETVIIMSYQDPKGLGEEDLFVSTKTNGAWSAPVHMGNKINSTGFEISPFLSASKDTLFFSSNGFKGLGDADIYYAIKGSSWTDWSSPVNLGAPINSEKFDAYFTYINQKIYWASNRNQKLSDIYTATLIPIAPLDAEITGINCSTYNVNDGKSSLNIKGGVGPYSIKWMDGNTEANRMNLKPGDYSVVVTDKNGLQVNRKVTILQPKEEMPVLNFVHYFDYNKYKIEEDQKLKDLIADLDKLNTGSTISVKIISSASNVPTKRYPSNQALSEKRAKDFYDLILKSTKNKNIVIKTESIVSGPAYNQDEEEADKYKQHQYVKIVVL